MKIYTRRGDDGQTGLFGGGRVPKHHRRVEAYGCVDELNAVLGWLITQEDDPSAADKLRTLQHDLFSIGAELATPPPDGERNRPDTPPVPAERVTEMEAWMDEVETGLPELRAFVLPGGSELAAAFHLARTVCRRAERRVTELAEAEPVDPAVLTYLNRLSDLFFMLARDANRRSGQGDVAWESGSGHD